MDYSDNSEHTDFQLRDLWHSLSQLEHSAYELQEALLLLGNLQVNAEIEDNFLNGACFVNSLDNCKEIVKREIVSAARVFCDDSQGLSQGLTSSRVWAVDTTETSAQFLKKCSYLVEESKKCINEIRSLYESSKKAKASNGQPKLEYRHGRWIKTFEGCELENPDGVDMNAFGRLKRDFDMQTSNILVLEKERNDLSIQIEVLRREKQACKCSRG